MGIFAETACTVNDRDPKQSDVTMTRKTSIQIKKYLHISTPQLKLNLCEQS